GTTVSPADLAPRPNGRNLSPPCNARTPAQLPYDGTLRGKLSAGGEDLKVDYVLTQRDDVVHGSVSHGKGIRRTLRTNTDGGPILALAAGSGAGQGIIPAEGHSYVGRLGDGPFAVGRRTFAFTKDPP